MAKKINIAIAGLGFGAEFIPIYQLHPDANMYAICQRNNEKLNQVGDAFKVGVRYNNFDELLKDPNVDAVHINTPIPDHAAQAISRIWTDGPTTGLVYRLCIMPRIAWGLCWR